MSQLTIEEVANGVSEILNARARGIQLASEQAKRLADEQAQRESEQAASSQRAYIEREWSEIQVRLADVIKRRDAFRVSGHHCITPDQWACQEAEYTNVMREKLKLQSRYPWLEGMNR